VDVVSILDIKYFDADDNADNHPGLYTPLRKMRKNDERLDGKSYGSAT
jgi:hypothetical protein